MLRRSLPLLLAGLGLFACSMPPTSSMRLTEASYDLNNAVRFGRMDIALEHVKEAVRDDFNQRHAGWGKSVRIVDAEMGAFSIRKDGDADIVVSVSWQRFDETSVRNTDITQRWSEKRGTWWMISEEERGGDHGLLAEVVKAGAKPTEAAAADSATPAATPAPAPQSQRQRYQTRVIYEQ
jgi:hypothetical protein